MALIALLLVTAWRRQRAIQHVIHELETDAAAQYKFHRFATWVWVVNLPLVMVVFVFFRELWDQLGLLYTLLLSLYANYSTDYGAMSSAIAAQRSESNAQLTDVSRLMQAIEVTLQGFDDRLADLQEARHDGC